MKTTLISFTLVLVLSAAVAPASAMTILEAADRLNAITPQAVPTQVIRVGTYDGATKQFYWNPNEVTEGYPPNVPGYKQEDEGGPMKPQHFVVIKSFNVTYEFEVKNKPANFSLKLSIGTAPGPTTEYPGTVSGNIARVSFHPRSAAYQYVSMTGLPGPQRITPLLLPQLGAFVVPRLLITVIYEPPGAQSWAKYETSSTAGTIVSWGFARSNSDLVKTVNEDEMRENFVKGVSLGLQALGTIVPAYKPAAEAASTALTTFNSILGNTTMQTTRTITSASSQFNGTFFTLSTWYDTDPNDTLRYPGQGDVFVILEDVLFVYATVGGKVALTPVGYKMARKLVSSQLDGYLPPAMAATYRGLDPWISGAPIDRPAGATSVPARIPGGASRVLPARFKYMYPRSCDVHGGEGNALTQGTISGTGTSTATTTTTVTKVTGQLASMLGTAGESSESLTYSSSRQTWNVNTQSAIIYLNCSEAEGAFQVDIYLDTLLGTFLSVQGPPLDYVAGVVTNSQGAPAPNQTVTLKIGGQSYTTVSNAKGEFRFRLTSMAKGAGSIGVGANAVALNYTGRPITNIRVVAAAGPPMAPAVGQPAAGPKAGAPGTLPQSPSGSVKNPGARP